MFSTRCFGCRTNAAAGDPGGIGAISRTGSDLRTLDIRGRRKMVPQPCRRPERATGEDRSKRPVA